MEELIQESHARESVAAGTWVCVGRRLEGLTFLVFLVKPARKSLAI